mmetsp:Transcript_9668/g.41543  ORF Transcript_9668/g.41543 Transcript_9668/m.41543 type:complete len:378 (+) Transcript_9668:827-1960(+)
MPDRESVCGTYFISDSGCNRIAVFKPVDEEWGQSGRPLSVEPFEGYAEAFLLGECAYKEAAAYLLDHNNNAGVPQTAIVKCIYPIPTSCGVSSGMGAFQVYQDNVGDADDYGPGIFSQENVQRIATFDLRVLNCDRHAGNLLVQETKDAKVRKLIPIDHGYILPDRVVTPPWPAWMQWPQVREPLCPSVKSYIQSVEFSHDNAMLEEELADKIHSGSLRTLRITTHLLKSGVDIGMSLYEIGLLVYSSGTGKSKSVLEKLADEAYAAGLVREQRIESQLDLAALEHSSSAKGKLQPTTEDFIVRYASKLIDRHLQVLQGFGSCISRARSHPNFLRRPSDKPPRKSLLSSSGSSPVSSGRLREYRALRLSSPSHGPGN